MNPGQLVKVCIPYLSRSGHAVVLRYADPAHHRCLMSNGLAIDIPTKYLTPLETERRFKVVPIKRTTVLRGVDGLSGTVVRPHGPCFMVRFEQDVVCDWIPRKKGELIELHKDWMKFHESCTCSLEQVAAGCKCGYFSTEAA